LHERGKIDSSAQIKPEPKKEAPCRRKPLLEGALVWC
jgi:hypothetical protein